MKFHFLYSTYVKTLPKKKENESSVEIEESMPEERGDNIIRIDVMIKSVIRRMKKFYKNLIYQQYKSTVGKKKGPQYEFTID